MTVNPQLAHDMWSYEEVVKRATSNLFNPLPVGPGVPQVKVQRYEMKRIALLYFIEGLTTEKQGALQYAYELAEDSLPPLVVAVDPARVPDPKAFDVVADAADFTPPKAEAE